MFIEINLPINDDLLIISAADNNNLAKKLLFSGDQVFKNYTDLKLK